MKWTKTKSVSGRIGNVDYELTMRDGTVTAAQFSLEGRPQLLCNYESYSMQVCVPAAPVKISKWKLHGSFMGMTPVEHLFDDEGDAESKKSEYLKACNYQDEKCGLIIEKVEVEEE